MQQNESVSGSPAKPSLETTVWRVLRGAAATVVELIISFRIQVEIVVSRIVSLPLQTAHQAFTENDCEREASLAEALTIVACGIVCHHKLCRECQYCEFQ